MKLRRTHSTGANMQAPVALQKPFTVTQHGDSRYDPFYWLRCDTRDDPEVSWHSCGLTCCEM